MMDDIDRIMQVMASAFDPQWGEAWNRRQVEDSLRFPSTHFGLLDEHGRRPQGSSPAAGFTLVRAAPGEEELLLIAVEPHLRGRGIGGALLEQCFSEARRRGAEKIFLEMRYNNPARSLYLAHGFEPIGIRKNYYKASDGTQIDAITLAKML